MMENSNIQFMTKSHYHQKTSVLAYWCTMVIQYSRPNIKYLAFLLYLHHPYIVIWFVVLTFPVISSAGLCCWSVLLCGPYILEKHSHMILYMWLLQYKVACSWHGTKTFPYLLDKWILVLPCVYWICSCLPTHSPHQPCMVNMLWTACSAAP